MKAVFLALGTLALVAQQGSVVIRTPGPLPEGALLDAHDHLPLLLGATTAKAILSHRAIYRDNLTAKPLASAVKARWQAVRLPFTVVVVFGSWCSDSQQQLPSLLALEAEPNPFLEILYLGVNRDKVVEPSGLPPGCAPQKPSRVPTVYVFAPQPGGGQKLVSYVVETPPRAGQTMAEAVLDILDAAPKP
jgi:hypothetical protein